MLNELSCEISGITFKNPLILASGILGVAPSSIVRLANAGIGAPLQNQLVQGLVLVLVTRVLSKLMTVHF